MTVKTFRVKDAALAIETFAEAGFEAAVTTDKVGFAGGCSDPGCCMQPSRALASIKVTATGKQVKEVMKKYHLKMAAKEAKAPKHFLGGKESQEWHESLDRHTYNMLVPPWHR